MPKLLRPLLFTLGMSALFTQAALPDRSTLQTTLTSMADWQITHFRDDYGRKHEWDNPINGWPYAAMYIGMERWADIAPDKRYYDFLLGVADENKIIFRRCDAMGRKNKGTAMRCQAMPRT